MKQQLRRIDIYQPGGELTWELHMMYMKFEYTTETRSDVSIDFSRLFI